MSNKSSRLLTLILLLQRQPNQKAADLAKELGISVRSLHRYFAMLDEMGIPVYAERGPNGGFSLVRGYRMPPLVLTPDEAVALSLGAGLVKETWGQLYAEPARDAMVKLNNLLPDSQRREVDWARRYIAVTSLHQSEPELREPNLRLLRQAAREHCQVRMVYWGSNQEQSSFRTVDPYGLVFRWGWWYVVGYCHMRQALRSFRLDRIHELTLTAKTFDPPPDFDISAYLETEFSNQPQIQVRLCFHPPAAHLAQENPSYWEQMEPQEDGSIITQLSVSEPQWAINLVLVYGPDVEILSPPELRQGLLERLTKITQRYLEQSSPALGIAQTPHSFPQKG